jgi:biotin carboxyl carrier protein
VAVRVRGSLFPVDLVDERRQRLRRGPAKLHPPGRQELLAPLPGRVVKLLAKPGEAVVEGQGLVLVEALGMENALGSPKDGRLVELAASPGQEFERGARLAVVE